MSLPDNLLLDAMARAALDAGRAVCRIYRDGFDVHRKADTSPVTAADVASEAIIVARLERALPGVPIVAEEAVSRGDVPAAGEAFFLVNPLDGTKEFIARRGDFTVNIALIRGGSPALGVVYAPARHEIFTGAVAAGRARRATQPPDAPPVACDTALHVRPVPAAGLTVVASRSHRSPDTDAYLAGYVVADQVSVGSSLKFCLVAAGEADLYPRLGPTMEWDTAAGHAVLLAAGGTVRVAGGGPLRYGKAGFRNPWFVAAGPFDPRPPAGPVR